MALKDFEFKSSYNRVDDNISDDFYLPCMRQSVRYDRISGYFGSTVFVIAWKALKEFLSNDGHIRIICSPVLSDEDIAAIETGDTAKTDLILASALENEFIDMIKSDDLQLPSRLLSYLISKDIVSIKIAIINEQSHPNVKALFHDKVGLFYDSEGNSVGFRGSFNETYKGLSNDGNIESADVFQSWDGGKELERIIDFQNLFERIWSGNASQSVLIFDVPEAVKQKIFEQAQKDDLNSLLDEIKIRDNKLTKWMPDPNGRIPMDHQASALDNWVKMGRRGILKHATGSGKTFTAICAINDALNRGEAVLIIVPSVELLHQWQEELIKRIKKNDLLVFVCGDNYISWKTDNTLWKWTCENPNAYKIVITTMSTASNPDFIKNVCGGDHLFIVADEVHNLGSKKRKDIFQICSGPRLGMSATPERYGDPAGTQSIFNYFGDIIQPEFSLEDAIKNNVLAHYFYYPKRVYLTSQEQTEWDEKSKEISKIIARYAQDGLSVSEIVKNNPRLSQLMIDRSRILKNASNKVSLALDIIKSKYKSGQKWLVYCDNKKQLKAVLQELQKSGFNAIEYYADMPGDRSETLKYFNLRGGIIVSIKCLDEGVDIPSATHALILASSKNPREFIQRRGRILRLSEGKTFAYLYDAIVLPMGVVDNEDDRNSIVLGELSRAIQFGSWAENPGCITDLNVVALDYNIDYSKYLSGGYEDDNGE